MEVSNIYKLFIAEVKKQLSLKGWKYADLSKATGYTVGTIKANWSWTTLHLLKINYKIIWLIITSALYMNRFQGRYLQAYAETVK